MKCKRKVIFYTKRNAKGQRIPAVSFDYICTDEYIIDYVTSFPASKDLDLSEISVCDGSVKSFIRAELDDLTSSPRPTLCVDFVCDKCGSSHLEIAVDEMSLNDFLDKILDSTP